MKRKIAVLTLMCQFGLVMAQTEVDLGLSVLWAAENLGAETSTQPGSYYEWDGIDHAAASLPSGWRTPDKRLWDELKENCSFKWTGDYDGMSGYIVTSMVPGFEGKMIFLPAGGWDSEQGVQQYGTYGSYWTRDPGDKPDNAFGFNFDRSRTEWHTDSRKAMQSIRPVRSLDGRKVGGIGLIYKEDGRRVDGKTIDMEAGYSHALLISAENRCVSAVCRWSSSDPAVASVSDDGVVFAISKGTATVTASVYGKSVKCKVRVTGAVHQSVDLGLSVRWAVQNVGATDSTDAGYFFSFAETTPKTEFSSSNYKYGAGREFTKYTWDGISGSHTLDAEDDAATANWGPDWHLPDYSRIGEVAYNCESQWTSVNGVKGVRLVSKVPGFEGRSIFIPAAGYIDGLEPIDFETAARVWSRNNNGIYGHDMQYTEEGYVYLGYRANTRSMGENVRPVTSLWDSDFEKLVMPIDDMVLIEKSSAYLEVGIVPARVLSMEALNWSSSNEQVATVSGDGIVQAVAPGKCVISASIGSKAATCHVTVKSAASETSLLWSDGQSRGSGVDLGLSVEWASCNVGAWNADEAGGYFTSAQVMDITASMPDGWRLPNADEYYELLRNSSRQSDDGRGWTIKSTVAGFESSVLSLPLTGYLRDKTSMTMSDSRFESPNIIAIWTDQDKYMFEMYFNGDGSILFSRDDNMYAIRLVRDIPGRKTALENSKRPVPACQLVDLGLSVLWATSNLGADTPDSQGEMYAWGETAPKFHYDRDTYSFTRIYTGEWNEYSVTKYSMNNQKNRYGSDDLSVLEPGDDAATVNLGQGWSIPTKEQWQELMDNCIWEADSLNGMQGVRITSVVRGFEDRSIFLPFARSGSYDFQDNIKDRQDCHYWSSNLDLEKTYKTYSSNWAVSVLIHYYRPDPDFEGLFIGQDDSSDKPPYEFYSGTRSSGFQIRPVHSLPLK